MSRRILVIPAAGLGSRLGAALPKLLVPVGGMPMIDRLARLYENAADGIVLIVHPSFAEAVRQHVAGWNKPVSLAVQAQPTGMLDAIVLASDAVRAGGYGEVCGGPAPARLRVDYLVRSGGGASGDRAAAGGDDRSRAAAGAGAADGRAAVAVHPPAA